MKWIVVLILLTVFTDIGKIAKINKLKKEAEKAFMDERYATSIQRYRTLVDSFDVDDDKIVLNLANAYYKNGQATDAAPYYDRLLTSENREIRSAAFQQKGLLAYQDNKMEESLQLFKEALKANPENEGARYNYELVKRLARENQSQDQQNQDQIEPSEYAKRLKAQSDQLVSQGNYSAAYQLMQNGLQTDPTVAYYQSFIGRLEEVAQIDEKY